MQFFIYLQNYLCFCFILPLGLFWFSRISELLHYHNTTTLSIKFLMFSFEKGIFPYLFKGNLFWFKWGSNSFLIFDQQTLLLIVYGHVFFIARILLSKNIKYQRNGHNCSKVIISLLKIGMILVFIIIYPISTSYAVGNRWLQCEIF